jgi:hypothetical protein
LRLAAAVAITAAVSLGRKDGYRAEMAALITAARRECKKLVRLLLARESGRSCDLAC